MTEAEQIKALEARVLKLEQWIEHLVFNVHYRPKVKQTPTTRKFIA